MIVETVETTGGMRTDGLEIFGSWRQLLFDKHNKISGLRTYRPYRPSDIDHGGLLEPLL